MNKALNFAEYLGADLFGTVAAGVVLYIIYWLASSAIRQMRPASDPISEQYPGLSAPRERGQ